MHEARQKENSNVLRHFFRILFLYRWTWISITALLVLAVTVAVFTMTPRYTAECMLMIEPGKMNITDFKDVYDPTMTQSGLGDVRREFTETQYHLLLSEPVLEKVFLRFGFGDLKPFKESSDPIKTFTGCFNVRPIRRTRLARVEFEWEDPEMAARALSFLVRTYIEEYRRRRLGITEGGLEALKGKAEELRPEVEQKAGALQAFMAEHNMVSLEETHDIIKVRLKESSTNLTRTEAERIKLESRYRSIKEAVEGKGPLLDLPEAIENEVIHDLKLELVKVAQEIRNFSNRFGANHPEMRRMTAKQGVLQGRIDQEVRSILAGAKADYDRIRNQEEELGRTLAAQEKRVMEQSHLAVRYNLLRDGYESTNGSYKAIIKRIEEIEIASAAGTKEDNVFEITSPRVPRFASYPRKRLSILVAGLIGLVLGVGLSFLLYSLDGSIKTVEDVEEELGISVLGHVPAAGKSPSQAGGTDLYALEEPHAVFAESFRSLRTALSLARAGDPLRRILVTSPMPAEGKDIISINIAISLARSGKRVLLIDGDMRRPRQHKVFGLRARPGLSNLLAGHMEEGAEACVKPTQVTGLDLLPSGPVPPNPVELISSTRMEELLEDLDRLYDVLVINSPPVMAVSDPVELSQFVQGTVLVVRSFSTRREEARRALELLHRAGVNLLGAVMNLVDMPRKWGGYYGYGYGSHGYDYDPDPQEDTDDPGPLEPPEEGRRVGVRLKDGKPEIREAVFEK